MTEDYIREDVNEFLKDNEDPYSHIIEDEEDSIIILFR